ncbi:MAG: hypothetical protein KDA37_11375, partial [Planctomycetales bacterium]|nr:hypothetical protein [Planctomycetales bacterium]
GGRLLVEGGVVGGVLTGGGPMERSNVNSSQRPANLRRVALSQHGFEIDNRMFYPRIVTHNGEALADLRQLGFNTVAFLERPTAELMKEAARQKLQVVCPCAPEEQLKSAELVQLWEPVIAWLLPAETDEKAIDAGAAWVEQIRRTDIHLQRPVLATPSEGWLPWSRLTDGIVVVPRLISAPAMQNEVEHAVEEARRFAQPGTPLLAAVSATHSESFMRQAAAFAPAGTVTPWRTPTAVAREAELAATLGACGVWVKCDTSLADNPSRPQRARIGLSRLNVKLALLEPWLRDGVSAGRATTVGAEQTAAIFSRSRTMLLVPRIADPASPPAAPLKYIASGVSESSRAYELTPVSLRPTEIVRLAGGARISAGRADSLLLVTEDTRAAAEVGRRVATMAGRAASLEQAMAIAELQYAESHLSPLVYSGGSRSPDATVLSQARREISLSKTAQSTRDLSGAYEHAVEANRILAEWGNERVAAALRSNSLESSPLANLPATIIDQQRLLGLIQPLSRGPNLLVGGNFENHQSAADSGWRHVTRDSAGSATEVAFSDREAAIGKRSLSIKCDAETNDGSTGALVVITSPPVKLRAGELIEVTGLVRVEQVTDRGTLTISDSLGGEELALSVDRPTAWRMFRLLRRSITEGPVTLRFAARGPITAGIDGVMVRAIELPSATKAAVFGAPALQRK